MRGVPHSDNPSERDSRSLVIRQRDVKSSVEPGNFAESPEIRPRFCGFVRAFKVFFSEESRLAKTTVFVDWRSEGLEIADAASSCPSDSSVI
jgi:hypothetical protein